MFSRTVMLALLAASVASAQSKPTVADFAGTWNIELMSHQIALVIEPQEGNKATATMMMMGRDVRLQGELVDRTITFVGVKGEGHGSAASPAGADQHAGSQAPAPRPITVSLQEDGTIAGEMMTTGGPAKWTGEKLRARKKPQQ